MNTTAASPRAPASPSPAPTTPTGGQQQGGTITSSYMSYNDPFSYRVRCYSLGSSVEGDAQPLPEFYGEM